MTIITPDLVEWLVADPKVSSVWRSMASHLSLSYYIPSLEVSRRKRRTDRQRLKELLIIWRSVRPATYTVETLLNMLDMLGMKDMYEWIHLITKDKLSPTSVQTYVISRQNCSQHSSLTEVRSHRIGRSITPRPPSCYYSSHDSLHAGQSRTTPRHGVYLNSSPAHSRSLSVFSDDLDSCLNYSRSSISPMRYTRSTDGFSPFMMKTSTPTPNNTLRHRRELVPTPLGIETKNSVRDRGVFRTLYDPDYVKKKKLDKPFIETDTVIGDCDTTEKSPKSELKQFEEAFTEYKERESVNISAIGTDKYFDNLVALIEEAARGLYL